MADTTLQLIRQLRPEGQAAVIYLVNAVREAGWPAIVVEARRGLERQRQLVGAGASKTLRSKHLIGRAVDIGFAGIPTAKIPSGLWSSMHDLWDAMGGGKRIVWDMNHFEW